MGNVGISYHAVDDEGLYREYLVIIADVCYENTRCAVECVERTKPSFQFDSAPFREDICIKPGPLVNPSVFRGLVGPQHRQINDVGHDHGIDIVSLDCDGKIGELVPIWLDNGVNTMIPIEVGTWEASIALRPTLRWSA